MEVIILAGGLGTRLRSVISEVPKCMAPVNQKPFLWYLLKYLTSFDVNKVILSVGYLREVIFKWVDENKAELPFCFEYSVEEEPLGTGGGIKQAITLVSENEVVVLNGDTFFNVDLSLLLKQHYENHSKLSLALKPLHHFDRYGNVECNGSVITAFKEKQFCESGQINGGVYILTKENEMMDNLPAKFSFETDVLQPQSENGQVYGFIHDGYFIDIGVPDDYSRANIEFTTLF